MKNRWIRAGLAVVAAFSLAQCRAQTPAIGANPAQGANLMLGDCGAGALQHLVGKPKSVLATMRFAQPVRIIAPATAVTLDFAPNRLNIYLDAKGVISALRCG